MAKANWQQELYDDDQRKQGIKTESVKSVKRTPKTDYKSILLNHLKFAKLPMPTHGQGCENKEYLFHPERKWRFDYCWLDQKVAVEYQGLNWNHDGNSGHQSVAGLMNDCEKFTEASLLGWTLILVTAETVNNGQAIGWIERALKRPRTPTEAKQAGGRNARLMIQSGQRLKTAITVKFQIVK